MSALFASSDYRPPVLPSVAMELVSIARQPDVPIPTVVKLLKNEQMLTARLLTLSQSTLYGRSYGPTLTLGQVILRLGLKRVADIFVQASMEVRMFRARGFEQPMNRLRRHSAATAEMARIVCQRLSLDDDHAFLCGLLHDVGLAAAIIAISEGASGEAVDFGNAWPAIFDVHEAAGRRLAEIWKLPTELGMVIGSHHGSRPFPSDTAAAVALADLLVSEQGAEMESECDPAALSAAAARLHLDADSLTQLRQDAARVASTLT
ncbi:MAG: HDOD domain-containing protein [Myxococcota bacterium]|nr:HDOD domain-containing protein [Myxococcota bacterium]